MTEAEREQLFQVYAADMRRAMQARYELPVEMTLDILVAVVAGLQLSLRDSRNNGPTARILRQVCDRITACVEQDGYRVVAEVMRMGNNPANDMPTEQPHT